MRRVPMSIVFVAISRTGNDPMRHDLFEVAAVHRYDDDGKTAERVQHWAIKPDRLASADPDELLRTGFYDRSHTWAHNGASVVAVDPTLGTTSPTTPAGVARTLAKMLLGAQLATFAIDREAEFLAEFLRTQREPCGWVGHVDVASAAAGALAGYSQGWVTRGRHEGARPSPSSATLSAARFPLDPFALARAIGVSPTGPACSALTRARLVRDVWLIISAPLVAGEPAPLDDPPADDDPGDLDGPDGDGDGDGGPVGLGGGGGGPVGLGALTVAYPNPYTGPLGAPTGDAWERSTGDVALDGVIRRIGDPDR